MPTVLLVDDDPLQLATRETVLRSAGNQIHVATTPRSALALLRSHGHEINLVVTDHIMPEVSGADFVNLMREISPKLPVLVVTGLPEAEDEYTSLPNVTFRTKPVPPPELIELVRTLAATDGSHS